MVIHDIDERWFRSPADHVAVQRGYYFDQDAADHVCEFFEQFLFIAPGKPFILEEWERDFLSRLFGWKRPDGTRRYTEAYLEICKKNGKSTLMGGLCVYGMIDEPMAGVYQGALDREQGKIVFREAARMVEMSPPLKQRFKASEHYGTVVWKEGHARLVCLSADVPSKDGINASLTVFDELHRFGRDDRMYRILEHAGAARRQPLRVNITTAGNDKESLCWKIREQAVRILKGATDDLHFLGVIYGADDGDDLDDPAVWRRVNPSMGSIINEERFAEELAKAKRSPAAWNSFKRLRLGLWTAAESEWIPLEDWDACAEPAGVTIIEGRSYWNPRWWVGRDCCIGVDLSSVRDLTSLTLATMDGPILQWHSIYFAPERTARERADRDGVPYPEWIRDGWIVGTDGNTTDYQAIRKYINDLRDLGINVKVIGFDPWNARSLELDLMRDRFDVVEIRQIIGNLTTPTKELERRILDRQIAHDGSPVTRWCVENCSTVEDAQGNIMPSKKKSTGRIDGVASGVMAVGLLTCRQQVTGGIIAV